MQDTDLLTTHEAAKIIGVKANTMRNWRNLKRGPAYLKFGEGSRCSVLYRRVDVRTWYDNNVRRIDPENVGPLV